MARINIEDSIWRDVRFNKLIMKMNSIDEALGILVRTWMIAQKWYLSENRMIPEDEWEKQLIPEVIIEVGLAKRINGFVRVCGADEQFAWLLQKSEAGRKGGLAKGKHQNDAPGIKIAGAKRSLSVRKPLPLTLSLTQIKNINTYDQNKFDLESVYALYPRKLGKSVGLKRLRSSIKTQEDFDNFKLAVQNYAHDCKNKKIETRYIKHFSSFTTDWREWIDYHEQKSKTGLDLWREEREKLKNERT